jgi:hypothetical protein
MEIPLASPGNRESASQESPTGLRGEDAGKKQRPICNGTDRKRQLLCDKQADFQQVMKDEKAGRTIV